MAGGGKGKVWRRGSSGEVGEVADCCLWSERRREVTRRCLRSGFLTKLCEAFGVQADGLWDKR